MDKHELRRKVKDCLINCLQRNGYPNLTITEVLALTKQMWVSLEDEQLIVPGMSYGAFKRHCQTQAMHHMGMDEMHDYMWSVVSDR